MDLKLSFGLSFDKYYFQFIEVFSMAQSIYFHEWIFEKLDISSESK